MTTILAKLNSRFQLLETEGAIPRSGIGTEESDVSWKDPNSADYDRQWAEDALFHTIGPLTDSPHWVNTEWTSPGEAVPGYQPGGPAPIWSPEEIVFAFAGDPNLFMTASGNPRSPMYGNKGGAPLLRTARKVARYYNRANDRQFIADLYSNGFIPLTRMMKPGHDESRGPFISWVIRNVQSAMEHGTGGTAQSNLAKGDENNKGAVGLTGLLDRENPEEIRQLAQQVKGQYQEQPSHDKHPDNPFGKYSAAFFRLANQYADAWQLGDEDRIDAARSQIRQQISEIEDDNVFIPGASTGMGQAISTPDRKTSIGISSLDVGGQDGEGDRYGSVGGETDESESDFDIETITKMYDIAINYDLGEMIGHMPQFAAMAAQKNAKKGKIGGKMTANELRYSIRTMGPLGSNYPGRGTVRANPDKPRDSVGWWEPGSDPEIEPIPNTPPGTMWRSIWTRNNFKSMGPTEISQEMTEEVQEFEQLGIPTARTIKTKTDNRSGKQYQEAVGKVAVATAMKSARIKLELIAWLERDSLGLGTERTTDRAKEAEAEKAGTKEVHRQANIGRQREIEKQASGELPIESVRKTHPLLEDIQQTDAIDRELIAEACDFAVSRIDRALNETTHRGFRPLVVQKTAKPPQEFAMQPVDALFFEEEEPPAEEPPAEGEEEAAAPAEEEEASPDSVAAWDASVAMAAAVGNSAEGIP